MLTRSRLLTLLLVLCIASVMPAWLSAAPIVWQGPMNLELWSNSSDWNPNTVPDGSTDILIPQGLVLGDVSFTLASPHTLEVDTFLAFPSTTTVTNEGTINLVLGVLDNGGTVTNAAGGMIIGSGSFNNAATFTNDGKISAALGSLGNRAGATFINNGDAGTGTANSANFGFGTLSNAGMVTNNSTMGVRTLTNQAGGSLTNNGTLAVGIFGSFTNAGTLINAAGGTFTGPFDNFTNQAGGMFVNSGKISAALGALTNNAGATFTNNGDAGTELPIRLTSASARSPTLASSPTTRLWASGH